MGWDLILKFFVLTAVISGGIIFALHRMFVSDTENAKKRLEKDAEAAREREAELSRKIKEADEELESRRKELKQIEAKMRGELEEEIEREKEEIIGKARDEAEEVIIKAQNKSEDIRKEVIKEEDVRIINNTIKVLEQSLSSVGKGALDEQLIQEFLGQLKEVDMSRIDSSLSSVDVVTARGVSDDVQKSISATIKEKLGRDVSLNTTTDSNVLGGVVLQFDSMVLDGSLRKSVIDASEELKKELEVA